MQKNRAIWRTQRWLTFWNTPVELQPKTFDGTMRYGLTGRLTH